MFGLKQLFLVPSSLMILLLSLPQDVTSSTTNSNSNSNSPSVRATHSIIVSSQEHHSYAEKERNTSNSNRDLLVSLPKKHALAFIPRGGGNHYDDYDYDSYDDISDPEPPPRPPPSRRRPPPKRPPPPRSRQGHSHSRQQHSNRPGSGSRSRSNARKYKPQKQNDALTQAKNLTQKSLSLATSATVSTLKTGGKAAYYLTAPKFVTRREVCGVWRLDQSIGSAACAANIEFKPQGDAVTKYKGEENSNGYLFQSRSWPRSCTIEFEAEAFQGPGDEVPMRFFYKGSFRRKVADKSVIKIVGKIYEVRKGRFGRGGGRGLEVGTFIARRRITANERNRTDDMGGGDDGFEDDYNDEYDDEEEGVYDDDEYDNDEY